MKRARKSNRISWAPGVNLCQVKLFLSEDCPSKVGQKSQDHLQAKTCSMMHSSTNESNDLPPGFEGNHFLTPPKAELSHISQIKWECPPLFVFSCHWFIASGEESREKEDQKLREMRVLEAVYPRLSAIPPSPSVSFDVEGEDYDDNLTPLIPIIPVEEEEFVDIKPEMAVAGDTSTNLQLQNLQHYISATSPISSQCNSSSTVPSPPYGKPLPEISPGLEADLAAASSVVATIMKSNEQGSLIDMDLLVRIFNDPIMIEKLINEHRTSVTTNTVSVYSGLKPATPSVPFPEPMLPMLNESASRITATSTGSLSPATGLKQATTSSSLMTPKPKKPAIPSFSVLMPTPDKPVTPSVSVLTPNKPATPSVPLSSLIPAKPATPSVPLPAPTAHMHRPVNKNIHHLSNGVPPSLDTQPPQQDTVLSSGMQRPASLASLSSSELNTVPLPSATVNLHAVVNQVQSTASTVPYQPGTGSAFAVKDANYYKNLIRQHGAHKHDMQDSQIGIRPSNFQDLKLVHDIKPGEVIFKAQKPCIYFKSSRGCRKGYNCPYQHDI